MDVRDYSGKEALTQLFANIIYLEKRLIEMKNKKEPADIDRSVLGVRDCLWSRLCRSYLLNQAFLPP